MEKQKKKRRKPLPKLVLTVKHAAEEEPKTLLQYLELTGNFKAHSDLQLRLAEKYYVKRGMSPKQITKLIAVRPDVIEKWAIQFEWMERRRQFEYKRWKRVSAIAKTQGRIDLGQRHDRIFSTVETLVEEMLQTHADAVANGEDEGRLSPKDLASLASIVKTTRGERRNIAGEQDVSVSRKEIAIDVTGKVDILQRVGMAVADFTRQVPQIEAARVASQKLLVSEAEDVEFEDD